MRLIVALLALVAMPAFAQQPTPSELDMRIGAMIAEKDAHIAMLSTRAATMAAEFASLRERLKEAEAKVCKAEEKK